MSGLTSKEKEGYAQGVELLLIIAILLLVFHFLWFCHEIIATDLPIRGFVYSFLTKIHRQFGLFNTPSSRKSSFISCFFCIRSARKANSTLI